MFDSDPYHIKFVQKSSPSVSDDFLFCLVYKFFTIDKLKYIVRAEFFENDVVCIKYYASRDRNNDYKYSLLTNRYNASRIFVTCTYLITLLMKEYPEKCYAFNASRSIYLKEDVQEKIANNQRFRVYKWVVENFFGNETFEHYEFPEVSSYLLVNRNNFPDTEKQKDKIREMFLEKFNFVEDI